MTINPAILLLDANPEEHIHDCLEILDIIQDMQPDLTDVHLTTRDADLYMHGSSFITEAIRYAGPVVATGQKEVI